MNPLNIKLAAFKSLYEQKDPFAALTDCHKDWQRDNELTEQLCILKQDILALGGKEELDGIVAEFKSKREEADKRLSEFNRKHCIEMMYAQYKRQYGWHDLDEQDQRFEKEFGDLWLEHQDDIWEQVCPKHRANKYAEQAIADSKIVEVCHD
jgi:hypothetical protein